MHDFSFQLRMLNIFSKYNKFFPFAKTRVRFYLLKISIQIWRAASKLRE